MYSRDSRHYENDADPLEHVCAICRAKSTEHCEAIARGWHCDRTARLLAAGYSYDADPWPRSAFASGGLMERVILLKQVTARKVWKLHAGTVQPGETYSMRVTRSINLDGESRIDKHRWVR